MSTQRGNMKAVQRLGVLALLLAGVAPAAAQSVTLEFKNDGLVNLVTQNASVSAVLAEWARRGKATIMNGERVPGPPVTLELVDVPEQQALDILLRTASGYLAAARDTPTPGTSRYDRIYIVPTSRVTTSATVLPPPPSTATPVPLVDDDDNAPPPGPGQRVVPPQTLPPGVRVPQQDANRLPPQGEEAPPRPAPTPSNPFGVAPGSSTPGVITPAPTPAGPPRER
jgi:hypothetical protein